MRRYWQPICASEDLKDLPKRVRILGEDLVAFRDGEDRPGLLFFRCSHRGTSLEYGRVEEQGLRCCYHGWLYDVAGNVLDMPLESPGTPFKDQIKHPCYPVQEFGGLVFAYMGPLEKMPQLRRYDIWAREGGKLVAKVGPRVGGAVDCNWLQSEENLMDALHTFWLHSRHSGGQFESADYAKTPHELKYEETDMGMRFVMTRKLANGKWWDLIWEMIMPFNIQLTYTNEPKTDRVNFATYCIPVDDTHQLSARIMWVPDDEDPTAMTSREKLSPASRQDKSYEYTQRHPDDKEAMEGQGPIAIHALEHRVGSDRGVIMFRKILRDAINVVKHGGDPKGIVRDPERARCIPTTGGSVVRDAMPE